MRSSQMFFSEFINFILNVLALQTVILFPKYNLYAFGGKKQTEEMKEEKMKKNIFFLTCAYFSPKCRIKIACALNHKGIG